ncbi:MAG TPA: hypothetical protein VGQ21_22850 [Thermoanaerobaculia bacterium]|nr:hypothetical protein [Thermoanaerobaculia bacterium]
MKKKPFAELVLSIREAGRMHGGEREAFRQFVTPDTHSSFLDLAGSVEVPQKKKGTSWKAIKAATWRHRATARK